MDDREGVDVDWPMAEALAPLSSSSQAADTRSAYGGGGGGGGEGGGLDLCDWIEADCLAGPSSGPSTSAFRGDHLLAQDPPGASSSPRTTRPPQTSRHGATQPGAWNPWQPTVAVNNPFGPPAALPTMTTDFSFTSPVPSHPQQQPSSSSLLSHHPITPQLNQQQSEHQSQHQSQHQRYQASAPVPDQPSRSDYFDFDVSLSAIDVDSSASEASSDGNASPMDLSASTAFITMTSTNSASATTTTPGRASTKRSSRSSTPTPSNTTNTNTSTKPHHSHSHSHHTPHYSPSKPSDHEPVPKRTLHRPGRLSTSTSLSLSTPATTTARTSPSAYPTPPDTLSTDHRSTPTTSTISINSKPPNTRLPHNQVEKKYREGLNTELERLRRAVPTLPGSRTARGARGGSRGGGGGSGGETEQMTSAGAPRPSKATILASAVEYIKVLERENERLVRLNEELREEEEGGRRGGEGGGGGGGFGWRRETGRGGEW